MSNRNNELGIESFIREFYKHIGLEGAKIYKPEREYINTMLQRYGPSVLMKALERTHEILKKQSQPHGSITDLRSTNTRIIKEINRSVRQERSIEHEKAMNDIEQLKADYMAEKLNFGFNAIKSNAVDAGLIEEIRQGARRSQAIERERYTLEFFEKVDVSKMSDDEIYQSAEKRNNGLERTQLKNTNLERRIEDEAVARVVADKLGFESVKEYIERHTTRQEREIEKRAIAERNKQDPKEVAKAQQAHIITSAVGKESEAITTIPDKTHPQQEAKTTIIRIEGYHFNPERPKQNSILAVSPQINDGEPFKLALVNSTVSHDGKKEYQPTIFDRRFVQQNPRGTMMVATDVKPSSRAGFYTRFARALSSQYAYMEGLLSMKDIYSKEKNEVRKRTFAINWHQQALTPEKALKSASLFRESQSDLRTAMPWVGYQFRIVDANNEVVELGNMRMTNNQAGRTTIHQDLVQDLNQLKQQLDRVHALNGDSGKRIEVTTFECIKTMPNVWVNETTSQAMLSTTRLGGARMNNGGQLSAHGVLSLVNDRDYGQTVTSIMAPNPDNMENKGHIQQRIKRPDNTQVTLGENISDKILEEDKRSIDNNVKDGNMDFSQN